MTTPTTPTTPTTWTPVCGLADLVPERGAAAFLDGRQVALFRLSDDRVVAVQQRDPFSGANVLSRGIVGSRGDVPTITSPMHKEVWSLLTGDCVDPGGKEPQALTTYPVRVEDGVVAVALP